MVFQGVHIGNPGKGPFLLEIFKGVQDAQDAHRISKTETGTRKTWSQFLFFMVFEKSGATLELKRGFEFF